MLADRDRNRHLWTYLDHSFVTLILEGHVVKIGKQLEPCNQSTFEIAKKYKVQLKDFMYRI